MHKITLKDKLFQAVPEIRPFFISAAKKYSKEIETNDREIVGIILPFATPSIVDMKDMYWQIASIYDKDEGKDKTQKLVTFCVIEGHYMEVQIPGQEVHIIYYDGETVDFVPKSIFDAPVFEAISKVNIENKVAERERLKREEEQRALEQKAADLKKKQSESIKPMKVFLEF